MDVITRNNYEAYFLLYADNELSPAERQAVEAFVASHPDLAAEFEALKDTCLQPEHIVFPAKNLLYKTGTSSININTENCEEYFILYYDNELNEADKKAVETFVANNPSVKEDFELFGQLTINTEEETSFPGIAGLYRLPSGESYTKLIDYLDNELPATEAKAFEAALQQDMELNKEFQLLSKTKLSADASVRFPNIQSLYRKEEKRRTPVVPMWMRMAAAAAVLLFIIWIAFLRNNGGTTTPGEAVATTKDPSPAIPANNNNNSTTQPANDDASNASIAAGNTDINNQPVNNALNSSTNNNGHVTSVPPVRNNNKQVVQTVPGPERQPALVQDKQPEQLPEELKKIIDKPQTIETIASVQPEIKNIKAENLYSGNKTEHTTYAANKEEVPENMNMVMGVIPADDIAKKSGLKSLGRKVSRFFERKIRNGNPLSIGGVEIARAR